jgi:hypothetical protein
MTGENADMVPAVGLRRPTPPPPTVRTGTRHEHPSVTVPGVSRTNLALVTVTVTVPLLAQRTVTQEVSVFAWPALVLSN